jgi:hypothetical protein
MTGGARLLCREIDFVNDRVAEAKKEADNLERIIQLF